jgi:hypothetical protein
MDYKDKTYQLAEILLKQTYFTWFDTGLSYPGVKAVRYAGGHGYITCEVDFLDDKSIYISDEAFAEVLLKMYDR